MAQFVLNHPVLPLFASLSAIGAAVSFIFGILYPPLLLIGLYLAILSGGMFVVDRQWIRFRPYVVYYLQKCFTSCRSRMTSVAAIARNFATPQARAAE